MEKVAKMQQMSVCLQEGMCVTKISRKIRIFRLGWKNNILITMSSEKYEDLLSYK